MKTNGTKALLKDLSQETIQIQIIMVSSMQKTKGILTKEFYHISSLSTSRAHLKMPRLLLIKKAKFHSRSPSAMSKTIGATKNKQNYSFKGQTKLVKDISQNTIDRWPLTMS